MTQPILHSEITKLTDIKNELEDSQRVFKEPGSMQLSSQEAEILSTVSELQGLLSSRSQCKNVLAILNRTCGSELKKLRNVVFNIQKS